VPIQTRKCKNPDHDYVQQAQPEPILNPWFVIPLGRGYARRLHCSDVCTQWYKHNYRDGVRVLRTYGAGDWEHAKAERRLWLDAGASAKVARVALTEYNPVMSLSLDLDMTLPTSERREEPWPTLHPAALAGSDELPVDNGAETGSDGDDGGGSTLLDIIAAPDRDPRKDTMPASVLLRRPLFDFEGVAARVEFKRPGMPVIEASNGFTILHDHADVQIVRDSDSANVTAIVLREALLGNTDAKAMVRTITSDAFMDGLHRYLEGLRVAAATGFELAGESPVIPPDASSVSLLERN
jgi:hypothetical protein